MGDDSPSRVAIFAGELRTNCPAAGQVEGDPETVQLFASPMHNAVRVATGAGDVQERIECLFEIVDVDREALDVRSCGVLALRHREETVWGKSRSMKRCAVGCGS